MTQTLTLDAQTSAAFGFREIDPDVSSSVDVEALLHRGLEECRQGEWRFGLRRLLEVATKRRACSGLPSLYFSYLGHAIAAQERRVKEGLRLCRHAVRMEFYQPENYLNLARTCLLADRRREASRAIARGLKVDAGHPELLVLRDQLGARRSPVLSFLPRYNLINKLLGRIRHGFRGRGTAT